MAFKKKSTVVLTEEQLAEMEAIAESVETSTEETTEVAPPLLNEAVPEKEAPGHHSRDFFTSISE